MSYEKPVHPNRMSVADYDPHTLYTFRCDDRAGFMLRILRAADGDLHISIAPDPDHEDVKIHSEYVSGSVRLRMPIVGGGSHEHLFDGIVEGLWAETEKARSEGFVK